MTLPEFWFVLIGFMFASYFMLEGFDFGVGALLPVLGKDDTGRRVMINTIGPVWDANETWLVLAAGAMFAAFPHWYATAFSAYYLPLLVILGALIVRGLAFEFRGKKVDAQWRPRGHRCIVFGPIVVPLLWGMFFESGGWHADQHAGITPAEFSNFLAVHHPRRSGRASMFVTHGAIFIALKTTGGIRHDAVNRDPPRVVTTCCPRRSEQSSPRPARRCRRHWRSRRRRLVGALVANARGSDGIAFFLTASSVVPVATYFAVVPERDAVDNRPANNLTIANAVRRPTR